MSSPYFGLLAEFGEENIPLDKVAPKYFWLSYEEAHRREPFKMPLCSVFDIAMLPLVDCRQSELFNGALPDEGMR